FLLMFRRLSLSTLFPYTTLFRSVVQRRRIRLRAGSVGRVSDHDLVVREGNRTHVIRVERAAVRLEPGDHRTRSGVLDHEGRGGVDRKSTRLNSSHSQISYAVFCL